MSEEVVRIHRIKNGDYDRYYKDIYSSDENNMQNFLKFIGPVSLILAHNAPFDMQMINKELRFWGLRPIPAHRFRCTMRIFHDLYGRVNPGAARFKRLSECCEIVGLRARDEEFHNALYDAEMTAKLICRLFDLVSSSPEEKTRKRVENFLLSGKEKTLNDIPNFSSNTTNTTNTTNTNQNFSSNTNPNFPSNTNFPSKPPTSSSSLDSVTSATSQRKQAQEEEDGNLNSDEAREYSQEDLDDLIKELA